MKRANGLRTLQELWELEDRHPLVNPSAGGLLRWMQATGMLTSPLDDKPKTSRSKASCLRTGPSRRSGKR
jgi:hypothetical protein